MIGKRGHTARLSPCGKSLISRPLPIRGQLISGRSKPVVVVRAPRANPDRRIVTRAFSSVLPSRLPVERTPQPSPIGALSQKCPSRQRERPIRQDERAAQSHRLPPTGPSPARSAPQPGFSKKGPNPGRFWPFWNQKTAKTRRFGAIPEGSATKRSIRHNDTSRRVIGTSIQVIGTCHQPRAVCAFSL